MTLETITDYVGIGTSEPSATLEVAGNVLASGTVGIGTTGPLGPGAKLRVTGGSAVFNNKVAIGQDVLSDAPVDLLLKADTFITGETHSFAVTHTGWVDEHAIFAIKKTGANANSVGIGTSEPTASLEVVGNIKAVSFEGDGSLLTNVSLSGAAGGDLTGSYPNPTISNEAVNGDKLAKIITITGSNDSQAHGFTIVNTGAGDDAVVSRVTLSNGADSTTFGITNIPDFGGASFIHSNKDFYLMAESGNKLHLGKSVAEGPPEAKMSLNVDSGNVGIGTSEPTASLEVVGTVKAISVEVSTSLAVGTTEPTAMLDVTGATGYNQVGMRTTFTPLASASAEGNTGDIAWDNNYIYIKTVTGGWKRATLEAF